MQLKNKIIKLLGGYTVDEVNEKTSQLMKENNTLKVEIKRARTTLFCICDNLHNLGNFYSENISKKTLTNNLRSIGFIFSRLRGCIVSDLFTGKNYEDLKEVLFCCLVEIDNKRSTNKEILGSNIYEHALIKLDSINSEKLIHRNNKIETERVEQAYYNSLIDCIENKDTNKILKHKIKEIAWV